MKKILFIAFAILLVLFDSKFALAEFEEAIEDNSFFIEEAYNQENRVVQHIFNEVHSIGNVKYDQFSFTQEWPFFGQTNQLSYTIPYSSLTSPDASGIGDIMLNYRYQSVLNDNFAFSPRLSFILPTGDKDLGLGNGVFGAQINLPISYRYSDYFVTHWNLGTTVLPGVEINNEKKTLYNFFAGGSIICLASRRFNMMLEFLGTWSNDPSSSDNTMTEDFIVSPGLRYSIPVESLKLEIVPGIAMPIFINKDNIDNGIFFYLSFEHAF